MERLVHHRQGTRVIPGDGRFARIQGGADGFDLGLGGKAGGKAGAFDLDQGARGKRFARLHQIQRRHHGADTGAAQHQSFQRQTRQGFADAGQPAAIALGQRLFVQPFAGRQPADDDVHQKLAIEPRLQKLRRPFVQPDVIRAGEDRPCGHDCRAQW